MKPLFIWLVMLNSVALVTATVRGDEGLDLFENRIRPVLVDSCFDCHSQKAGTMEAELALDNRASVLRGSRSGPVVVPHRPEESRLLRAIEYHDKSLQMPPDGRLPPEVVEAFRRWIALGAPDPREGTAPDADTIAGRAAVHWAFLKPVSPELPADATGWSRSPVDQLIAAELLKAGLTPSPDADPRTLAKRLYFDLIGLAPTHDELEAFVNDDNPQAYDKLVDRLLASPKFGERWARHWLDVARFADTKGYVFTQGRDFPNAFKYRDWVVNAFNSSLPINEFIFLQLAADQQPSGPQREGDLAAQGYVTLGRRYTNNEDDIAADRIDVIFRGMMGLTVACARCHDHKFDPISDEDYYATYGILFSSREEQDDKSPLRLVDKDQPENVGVFIRGSSHNRGPVVERGFPTFFASFAPKVKSGSGRTELAQAIVHPDNPLTARVFVNRVWGHLFGGHLVRSPSDFGLRCDCPLQHKLLDYLATDFMKQGWSLKALVRSLVSSSTYRQSSAVTQNLLRDDPQNELWGRANRRRLDFESLRDRLLMVADQLDERIGGVSENITAGDGGTRRTLYAKIDRQNLPEVFRTFDFASPDAHSPTRLHTLVPQQALFLMNGKLIERVALAVSNAAATADPGDSVGELYRRILAREPVDKERDLAKQFLARHDPELLPPDEWSFGFGQLDAGVVRFEELPHFIENRWQAKSSFPDSKFGYVSVTPTGGHPGRTKDVSSIRRWTAPKSGTVIVEGELVRPEQQGDGVEASVVSSRQGIIANWKLASGTIPTAVRIVDIMPGEHIDFVVSAGADDSYDTYVWRATLTLENSSEREIWNSEQDYHGPPSLPLDLWAQFAQVLLMSNEFLYID